MKTNLIFSKSAIALAVLATMTSTVHSEEIEKISVTAQKRTQSITEVGVTTTAFNGDALEDLGVENAVDLGAHTPGLVAVNATSGGTPIFAIRGIGLDDFSPNNSSGVGVYTDEVFASSPVYLGGQLFDIERVEVLKGPQGTLYGKNTTGGAINFITKKPTDDFEAFVEADYSSYDTVELTSAVGGALTDTMNARLSVNYAKSNEGWQEDVNTGEEFGLQDSFAIRGQLGFELGDSGTGLLRVYASQDKGKPLSPDSEGNEITWDDPAFAALNSPAAPDKVSVGELDVQRDESGSGVALTLDYSFDNFDFVSITSFDQYEKFMIDNYDGSAASTMELIQDDELEQWSQEIRFISTGNDDFSWVLGANISNEEVDAVDLFDDSFFVSDSGFDGVFYPEDLNAFGDDRFVAAYVQETDSYGVYLHTETQLNDSWKFIAGVRYSFDERSFNGTATNESFGDVYPVTMLSETNDEDAITGKIGLDWKVNRDLLVFGNVSTSYKGGVYYGGAVLDSSAWSYVEPEDVTSVELGFKWTLLEGSMQLNGAAFALEYENRQSLLTFVSDEFSDFSGFAVADTTLANIPESETSGFELDIHWLPIDDLTLQAGVSYLKSEVTKAPDTSDLRGINADPSVNDLANENGFGFVDALAAPLDNGTVLAQAPEWSYNALVAYDMPLENDKYLRFQTSYSWSDEQYAQLADSNALYGSNSSLNGLISLSSDSDGWAVTLWARNLLDNDAETYSFTGFSGRTVYRQQPATFGLTVKYEYY
ncbi:TonB-dependent receptor [Thalassotalea psychrophila]|uniref:TonB-dependent receptor n=1 Tax=Thalassotalea psychrophila TaxID=3065647 RepID=A0ABY9TTC8_9GAMM|nr:TonB-dependent receptor [Colwelliaceae bacterium SQ149]